MDQIERELDSTNGLNFTDVILPSQFFAAMGGGGLCSEQRLMLAVLVDAINILQGWKGVGSGRKRRLFAEAAQWVNMRNTSHPFSFDSICDALAIHPEILRQRLSGLIIGRGGHKRGAEMARLRLKESGRAQHMTAHRVRRRRRTQLAAVSS